MVCLEVLAHYQYRKANHSLEKKLVESAPKHVHEKLINHIKVNRRKYSFASPDVCKGSESTIGLL